MGLSKFLVCTVLVVMLTGCRSTSFGEIEVDTVFDSIFHGGETAHERVARQDQERNTEQEQTRWKQYWRENPEANPRMTEAFAKE